MIIIIIISQLCWSWRVSVVEFLGSQHDWISTTLCTLKGSKIGDAGAQALAMLKDKSTGQSRGRSGTVRGDRDLPRLGPQQRFSLKLQS